MEHDIDEHFFTTRIIHGHAILRTDYMLSTGTYPDHFRKFFIHPIPDNFKRTKISVTATEDGNAIEYTVIDTEQPFVLDASLRLLGVTKIEAYHNVEIGTPSFETAFANVAGGTLQGGTSSGGGGGFLIETIKAIVGAGVGFVKGVNASLPQLTHTFIVRVWGHRGSTRTVLEKMAYRILSDRFRAANLGQGFFGVNTHDSWWNVSHDLMGKWVEVQCRMKRGSTKAFLETFITQTNLMPPNEETISLVTGLTGSGMGLGTETNTVRGSFYGKLIAQQLQEPCASIPTPLANTTTDTGAVPRM
jgi:hypothetical protein